jgi:hypothetical protein
MPTFDKYTREEASSACETFVTMLRDRSAELNKLRLPTHEWTHFILDWFSSTAPKTVRVDATGYREDRHSLGRGVDEIDEILRTMAPHPRKTTREFVFDLCHSTWIPDGASPYWIRALETPPVMLLALESEMGKASSAPANLNAIMEDASKLLHVCARVKVVVFGSVNEANRLQILKMARKMVLADQTSIDGQAPTWAWIDVPWAHWTETLQPRAWVSSRGAAGHIDLDLSST